MRFMEERWMEWLVRTKKPSVSAAWISSSVMISRRVGKSWREILGMVRVVYLVGSVILEFVV